MQIHVRYLDTSYMLQQTILTVGSNGNFVLPGMQTASHIDLSFQGNIMGGQAIIFFFS